MMMRTTNTRGQSLILTAVFVCFTIGIGWAESSFCGRDESHPIDVWFDVAIQEAETTMAMRHVQADAHKRWDDQLNRLYKDIRAKLSEADRKRFTLSQRRWLAFRELELQFLSSAVYNEGSIAPVIISDVARQMLRTRVCQFLNIRDELAKDSR